MAFNGRSGHARTKQPAPTKEQQRWLKNRSADKLLDELVPKPALDLDLDDTGVRILHDEAEKK